MDACSNSTALITASYAIGIAELLVFIPTIPIVLFCFPTVYQTAILHTNLKGILLAQLFCIFLHMWPRIYVLFDQFIQQNIFLTPPIFVAVASTAVLTFNNMAGHVLIVERIYATIYVKTYEACKSWTFTIAWVFITSTLCLSVAVYQGYAINSVFAYSYIFVAFYIGAMIASFVEIFIFSMVTNFNKKLFVLHYGEKNGNDHELSVRYQLNENIRAGRQLAPIFICHFIAVLLAFIVAMNFQFTIITNFEQNCLLYQALFLVHAFNNLALPLAMLYFHPMLHRKVLVAFRNLKKLTNNATISPSEMAQPLDTLGRPFRERIRKENSEKDAYFKQLQSAWETA
uniref:Gustatory receptor n=1 Tax=Globodera rostochiensis TaxID=31243 RepID=A0A914HL31_GLORO